MGDEARRLTSIAGTVLKYYRTSKGLTERELAQSIGLNPERLSKAENGILGVRFFQQRLGLLGHHLELGGAQLVTLMNALWVDEMLNKLGRLTKSEQQKQQGTCFPLLQWLWYYPDARSWLKVLFLTNPSAIEGHVASGETPCLMGHPTFATRRWPAAKLGAQERAAKTKGGAAHELPDDVLRRPLLTEKASGTLTKAIRNAQNDALAILRNPSATGLPKVAEMLLLFADVAKRETTSHIHLRRALEELDQSILSSIDLRYRARALYLLGIDDALCDYARDSNGSERYRSAELAYYANEVGDHGDGTLTLQSLCSHLQFARTIKSAPILVVYLSTTKDLIASKKRTGKSWSTALGNLRTTRRLYDMVTYTLREFDHIDRRLTGAAQPSWADHQCAHQDPTCQGLAEAYAREIRDAISDSRDAMGF